MRAINGNYFFFVLCALAHTMAYAQKDATISNIIFEPADDYSLKIEYTLTGDPLQSYDVEITFRRESVSAFSITPKALTGDVKDVKADGKRKRIVWKYLHEYTPDPTAEDYYFKLSAQPVSGGIAWYYYVGGAALAGGAAAFLLGKKSDNATPSEKNIGAPPARP